MVSVIEALQAIDKSFNLSLQIAYPTSAALCTSEYLPERAEHGNARKNLAFIAPLQLKKIAT